MRRWAWKGPARFSSLGLRRARCAKDSGENLVHVAQLAVERKGLHKLRRAEAFADLRILRDRRAEVAFLLPRLHGVGLHDAVRLLAQHAGGGEIEQQLAREDEP